MPFASANGRPSPISRPNDARAAKAKPAADESVRVNLHFQLEYAVIGRTFGHIEPLPVYEIASVDPASYAVFVSVELEVSRKARPEVPDGRARLST